MRFTRLSALQIADFYKFYRIFFVLAVNDITKFRAINKAFVLSYQSNF